MAQRHLGDEIRLLRGLALRRRRGMAAEDSLIGSADEFVAVLNREFELDLPEAAALWPNIVARHAQLFPDSVTP